MSSLELGEWRARSEESEEKAEQWTVRKLGHLRKKIRGTAAEELVRFPNSLGYLHKRVGEPDYRGTHLVKVWDSLTSGVEMMGSSKNTMNHPWMMSISKQKWQPLSKVNELPGWPSTILMTNVRARVEYWSQLLISENVGVGAGRLCVDRGRREKGQSMGKDFYKVEM